MLTIAVIALKGGSGKTTLATHIALGSYLRGRNAFLADVDPQRSATEILSAREGPGPKVVGLNGADLFSAQLGAVGAGVEVMVIDTAAGAVEDVGQSIVLANLSILVVRPTLLDLAAMVRTLDVVRRLKKEALVVVNQAPVPRGGIEPPVVKRALRALDYMRLPVAPTILRTRAIYQVALETGRSAEEASDPTAAAEFRALYGFIERMAFGAEEEPRAAAEG
jgi:chromosome partitioning protein